MQRFKASLDTTAKMVTVTVFIVVIFPFIFIFEAFHATHEYRMLIAPIVVVAGIAITALWRPTAYSLSQEGLSIHRIAGEKLFPLHQIVSAALTQKDELGLGLRTFGSGGVFGYLGKFWFSKAKSITMYVTDRSRMILITLESGKKIMISPDESVAFLNTLNDLKK